MEPMQARVFAEFTPGTWSDISADILPEYGWESSNGNQNPDPVAMMGTTGILRFTLDNGLTNSQGKLGLYSPAHANCRAGFGKGLPIRLLIDHGTNKMGSKKFGADGDLIYSLASPPSITPTLEGELLADPGLEANYTAGLCDSLAKSGAPTVSQSADVHGGAKAQAFQGQANGEWVRYVGPASTTGKWYRGAAYTKRLAGVLGNTYFNVGHGSGAGFLGRSSVQDAAYAQHSGVIRAISTNSICTWLFSFQAGAGDQIVVDDMSLQAIGLASLFGSLQTGAVNVSVSAGITIPSYGHTGAVVLALDSDVTPANFILVRISRDTGYSTRVYIEQCIAGVYTTLAGPTTIAYVAGATLKAIKANGYVTVYYNGVIVGSAVKVTETAYTLCSLFATDVTVTFANLAIYNLVKFDDTYETYQGELAAAEPSPGQFADRICTVEVRDWFDIAAGGAIGTLPVQFDRRIDQVLPEVLAKCAKPPPRVYTMPGKSTWALSMDAEFGNKTRILTALAKLSLSEFAPIYMRGGTLAERYALWQEHRQYRYDNQGSIVTLQDNMETLSVRYASDDIWNSVKVTYYPPRIDVSPTVIIAAIEEEIYLLPGETKEITLEYRDPSNLSSKITAIEVQAPVPGVDYFFGRAQIETGTGGMTNSLGLTYEAGASLIKVSLTNNATSGGWVSGLRFYGRGIYLFTGLTVTKESSLSSLATGTKQKAIDLPYESRARFAEALVVYLLSFQKDWQETVRGVSFLANTSPAFAIAALAGDPGKFFTLKETATGIDKLFCITGRTLRGEAGSPLIRCTWACVPADTHAYWVMGVSAMGTETVMGPI